MALEQDFLRLIPIAIFHRTLQICSMVAVEVLEYPILIFQAAIASLLRLAFLNGGVGAGLEGRAAGGGEGG